MAGIEEQTTQRDRYVAAMVMAGAGDSLGYKRNEWKAQQSGQQLHKAVAQLGGLSRIKNKLPTFCVSDDTVMHLATGRALIAHRLDSPLENLYDKFAHEYIECMKDMEGRATGDTCKKSCRELRSLRETEPRAFRLPFNPSGAGCGAAMRSMCIGLRYPNESQLDQLITVAIESGRMTHHHPTGYLGSLVGALFTAYAIQDKPLISWGATMVQLVLPKAKSYIESMDIDVEENLIAWSYFENHWKDYLALRKITDGCSKPVFPEPYGVEERDAYYKSISFSGKGGASGPDSTIIAYDALLGCESRWQELANRAIFHGGDNDSTGTIAACWFGASYGLKGVHEKNHKKVEYRDQMVDLANKLYDLNQPLEVVTIKLANVSEEKLICQANKERYIATMVMAGVGDSIGYKRGEWEFETDGEIIHKAVSRLGGLSSIKNKLPTFCVSDDTVMHLATGRALVSHKPGAPMEDLYSTLAKEYIDCMGDMSYRAPGCTCKASCDQLIILRESNPKEFRLPFSRWAGGCGAAMRSMCIGLRYPNESQLDQLIAVAIESGRMTHHHPTGCLGSLVGALFTSYAIQDKPVISWGATMVQLVLPKAKSYIESMDIDVKANLAAWSYFEDHWTKYLIKRKITDGNSKPVFPKPYGVVERDAYYKSISFSGRGGASGHDSTIIAYDAMLACAGSWTELAKRAVFHGGDSDSTGTIASGWFGALYGFKGVAGKNHKKVEYRDQMVDLANKLYDLSHVKAS